MERSERAAQRAGRGDSSRSALPRLVLCAAACAIVAGCGAHRGPAPTGPSPGYERRVDSLSAADTSALRGRRIALDPGHGGFFRGSLGVAGLTEAQVNLGVALRLRDLLVANGAEVLLTRETDRDFLTPADSSLRTDLAERVRLANEFRPDLFVSIHHNADAGGAHDVNETQTYWKMSDEGPSFEAAQDVHRALVRNVGIAANRLLPGNYAVLRNSDAAAILTESSYLTYPPTEKKLRTEEAQQLEAEALWLGVTRYFGRAVPVIEELFALAGEARLGPDTASVEGPGPTIVGFVARPFDAAELRIDGQPQVVEHRDGMVRWTPNRPLDPGLHVASLTARFAGAGTSRSRQLVFRIHAPVERLVASGPMQAVWRSTDEALAVRVDALDRFGRLASDPVSLRIRVLGERRRDRARFDTTIVTRDGHAWAYVRASGPRQERGKLVRIEVSVAAPVGRVAPDTLELRTELGQIGGDLPAFARTPDGRPVVDAPGTTGPWPRVTWVNRDGFGTFRSDVVMPPGSFVEILPGYRRTFDSPAAGEAGTYRARAAGPFVALFSGALHGRRIAIDPAGSGDIPGVAGPVSDGVSASGTRAATLNLEVARALAEMLRAAGAEALLVRDGVAPVFDVERVRRAESFRAERYLRIGHGTHAPRLGYYYSSGAGRAWAARTAATLEAFGLPAAAPAEDAQWALQQTSCPALYASLGRVTDPADEARLLGPGTLRREAYALFVALAREWAPEAAWSPDSLVVQGPADRRIAGAIVTWGGSIALAADTLGVVRFLRTEPGPIEAVFVGSPDGARRVLLDSDRGVVLRSDR